MCIMAFLPLSEARLSRSSLSLSLSPSNEVVGYVTRVALWPLVGYTLCNLRIVKLMDVNKARAKNALIQNISLRFRQQNKSPANQTADVFGERCRARSGVRSMVTTRRGGGGEREHRMLLVKFKAISGREQARLELNCEM